MGKYFLVLLVMVVIGVLINHYLVLINKNKSEKMVNFQHTLSKLKNNELYADNNKNNRYTVYRVEAPNEYRAPNAHKLAPKNAPTKTSDDNGDGDIKVNFFEGYKVDTVEDDPKTLDVSNASQSNSEIHIASDEFSSFSGDKNKSRHQHPSNNKKKGAEKSPNPKTSTRKARVGKR